jgi:hypothetical protein
MEIRKCQNCNIDFTPKNEMAKYCSTKCKTENFYKRKIVGITPVQQPINTMLNDNITNDKPMNNLSYEAFHLIMAEQEKRHQAEIEKIKAELRVNEIENKIEQLRKEMKEEEEKEPTIAGFKLADIVQAYSAYQQMQSFKTEVK